MQKHVNLVDLFKTFPTNIFLQNLTSIQKRTSPVKFAHLAEKSGKSSISNLSTKAGTRASCTTHCRPCRNARRDRPTSSAYEPWRHLAPDERDSAFARSWRGAARNALGDFSYPSWSLIGRSHSNSVSQRRSEITSSNSGRAIDCKHGGEDEQDRWKKHKKNDPDPD